MPIQLGAPPEHGFDRPLGLLSDCHRRIERFLEQLIRVVDSRIAAPNEPLSREQRTALTDALRYFRDAAPLHNKDEEESLFPRLRASSLPEAAEALEDVAILEAEHASADLAHAEVDRLGNHWLAYSTLDESELARMRELLVELREQYRRHIAFEDTCLFPLAARLLTTDDQNAIGREMAVRRGLPPTIVIERRMTEIRPRFLLNPPERGGRDETPTL